MHAPREDRRLNRGLSPMAARAANARNPVRDPGPIPWSYPDQMRVLIAAVLGGLAIFGLVTWLALEGGGGVAVLETKAPDGTPRVTRVWVADREGALWLEAPNPHRAWLQDVSVDPFVSLAREGHRLAYR